MVHAYDYPKYEVCANDTMWTRLIIKTIKYTDIYSCYLLSYTKRQVCSIKFCVMSVIDSFIYTHNPKYKSYSHLSDHLMSLILT